MLTSFQVYHMETFLGDSQDFAFAQPQDRLSVELEELRENI